MTSQLVQSLTANSFTTGSTFDVVTNGAAQIVPNNLMNPAYMYFSPADGTVGKYLLAIAGTFYLPIGLTGSQGVLTTNPTGTQNWPINVNGTQIGLVAIATNGAFSFTLNSAQTIAPGDILSIEVNSVDDTLAGVNICLLGQRLA